MFILILSSCVSEVDFNQSDDLSFQPTHMASLVHFNFDQYKFLDNSGNEIYVISESSSAPLVTGTFAKDYLAKVEIQFKISNTFNRTMIITLQFYNANNQLSYQFLSITIPPNSSNKTYTEVISGVALNNFLIGNLAVMQVISVPNSGAIINTAIPKNLNVQVSGQFYSNIQNR
ncbi:MAG: hypothetical protein Q8J84_02410 [Flavobacteriaceae bacterium]|nr:hypothetical protein [Flavobacteriaceae bacterium]